MASAPCPPTEKRKSSKRDPAMTSDSEVRGGEMLDKTRRGTYKREGDLGANRSKPRLVRQIPEGRRKVSDRPPRATATCREGLRTPTASRGRGGSNVSLGRGGQGTRGVVPKMVQSDGSSSRDGATANRVTRGRRGGNSHGPSRGSLSAKGPVHTREAVVGGRGTGRRAVTGGIRRGRGGSSRGIGKDGAHSGRKSSFRGRDMNHHGVYELRSSAGKFDRKRSPIGVEMLRKIVEVNPKERMNLLFENKYPLKLLLSEKIMEHETIELLLQALARACSKPTDYHSQRLKDILLLLDETSFLDRQLTYWITTWPERSSSEVECEKRVNAIIDLLTCMLEYVPSSINSIGVLFILLENTLKGLQTQNIHMSSDLKLKMSTFDEERCKRLQEIRKSGAKGGRENRDAPPNDFRHLPILPTTDELKSNYRPFLRTNIVNGNYKDVHHYLDVHFRLLKEDFVQPLREGIAEYTLELTQNGPKSRKRIQNFSLYNNVKAVEINTQSEGLTYVLQFDVETHLKKVKWDVSKRLTHGSLVCLSRDHFSTLIFGTVANRDLERLRHGQIEVDFDIDPVQVNELFTFPFTMAESPSYFEAYCHVLKCLQTINQQVFPFTKYLVETDSGLIPPPKYVTEETTCPFDMTGILRDAAKSRENESSLVQNVSVGSTTQSRGAEFIELQTLDQQSALLTDYFAATENGFIPSPTYTAEGSTTDTTGTSVATLAEECEIESKPSPLNVIDIRNENKWPSAEVLGFDESQMAAFQSALTEEVCLIQGPPGTGKTFVGLKIAKVLLQNRDKWGTDKPMLVVCYTNHALDQFLEGILEFEPNIVRIGSRSKSEKLEHLNIKEVRRKFRRSEQYPIVRNSMKKLAEEIERCKVLNNVAENQLLKAEVLHFVMNEDQYKSLQICTRRYKYDPILKWLRILEDSETFSGQNNEPQNEDHTMAWTDDDVLGYIEEERRYIDDKDDFLNSVKAGKSEIPKAITVFFPVFDKDPDGQKVISNEKLKRISTFLRYKLAETDVMSKEEAFRTRNVWRLNPQDRWRLYRRWIMNCSEQNTRTLHRLCSEYDRQSAVLNELRIEKDLLALKGRAVIGVTTTGAAKYNQLIRNVGAPIIIIEEAAEILEAHVITSLTEDTQHLILIGDHQQLRPNPTVYKLCKNYKLDVSLFERMINNNMPYHRLSLQHRMRPGIADLLRVHEDFYPGLLDHEMVTKYEDIRGLEKNVFFVDHSIVETHVEEGQSRSNVHEASFLVALYKYLLHQGYSSNQITILTAYKGQVRTLNGILKERKMQSVRVCPIDNFQGEENDIILFSFVRSNTEGSIGFLKISNRVCVALSRAKMGLYCIGNFTLLSQESNLWKVITADLRERKLVGTQLRLFCRNHPERVLEASDSTDFLKSPNGGCNEQCTARLNCGHTCQLKCHLDDKEHRTILCKRPCETVMCNLGHICPKKCFEECGDCLVVVNKTLPCGHEQFEPCFKSVGSISCQSPCEEVCELEHACPKKCFEDCGDCLVSVKKALPCNHEQYAPCFKNPESIQCQSPCEKACELGHVCRKKCFEICGPCQVWVNKTLPCNHEQSAPCFKSPKSVHCSHPCERKLPCGHPCKEICGDLCTMNCNELVSKVFEPCGHSEELPCYARFNTRLKKMFLGQKIVRCSHSCEQNLPCGHQCREICGKECTTKCNEITLKQFKPCGHKGKVPCFQDECPQPCATVLKCQHLCQGTCGECQNGRYHVQCREVCKKTLVCGHICEGICSRSCPPCPKPCENRCTHGACPKYCWERCDPCNEKCSRECKHNKCGQPCGEACDKQPCNRNCPRKCPKKCKHKCIGICGDPCPTLCRICDKKEVSKLLSGREGKRTRFIQLEDCGHIVEERALDKLLKAKKDTREIKLPGCPWCGAAIRNSHRHHRRIMPARQDVDRVKSRLEEMSNTVKERLKKKISDAAEKLELSEFDASGTFTEFIGFMNRRRDPKKWKDFFVKQSAKLERPKRLCPDLLSVDISIDMYYKIKELDEEEPRQSPDLPSTLIRETEQYQLFLNNRQFLEAQLLWVHSISDQELCDWTREYRRCRHTLSLIHVIKSKYVELTPSEKEKLFDEINLLLMDGGPFTEEMDKRVVCLLKEMKSINPLLREVSISEEERKGPVGVAGFSRGEWCKCPRGHVYALLECKDSRKRCPKCGI